MLDVRGISNVTDYFIICSGNSTRQNKAIAEHVIEKLKGRKQRIWHVEGLESGEWVLLDGIDVVIHIFTPALRRFYELEKLWAGAPTDRFVG